MQIPTHSRWVRRKKGVEWNDLRHNLQEKQQETNGLFQLVLSTYHDRYLDPKERISNNLLATRKDSLIGIM